MNKKTTKQSIYDLVLAAMFLAIGLVLPFFTGQIPQIGSMLLPMHIPVLLCGLICGWQYGALVGFICPLLRFSLFYAPPMVTAIGMAFELCAYGAIVGFLYGRSKWKCIVSLYRSLIIAMIGGRVVWGIARVVMLGVAQVPFGWEMFVSSALLTAIPGIILQLMFIPALMVVLDRTGLVRFHREQPNVQSRRCLEIANKYGKPVTVMEPCKGGTLVNLPEEAEKLLRSHASDASNASWAMRFAASQPGVVRVLSGMNTMEQVLDNTAVFRDFQPLNKKETALIQEVTKIIETNTAVACTGCGYCTHGCPKNIAIPQYFALYNNITRTTGSFSSQAVYYNNTALTHGKASDCINCRQCERACPQHLPITDHLKAVAGKFEAGSSFPTRK